jgi:hypothetical protein
MLDPNVMPDYGKLKSIFEMANYQENLEVLQEVLEKGQVACEQIYQFDFSKPFRKKEFINFSYYLGNLAVKGRRRLYRFGTVPPARVLQSRITNIFLR